MQTARIFTSGNSQFIRLPKEFRFDEDEVVIKRVGNIVMLYPTTYREQDLLATLKAVGPIDIARNQPRLADVRASID